MAIFNFPSSPVNGQTYLGPNGVTYTWDGEKWTGSGAGTGFSGDWLDKTPLPFDEQILIPGQPTDKALRIKALPGQSGNLLEFIDPTNAPLTVFDEAGRLGVGYSEPSWSIQTAGDISFDGGLRAGGSFGLPGQHLVTNGVSAYWADDKLWTLDAVLAAGSTTTRPMTVGDMNVRGNLNVTGTQTIVNTEVIKLADNIITLNSNYAGSTPNENAGLEVNRGTLPAKYFFWDETLDKWSIGSETFKAAAFEGAFIGNVTGTVSSLANHDTNDLPEGSNNLYFTNARARQALTVTGDLQYNSTTGVLNYNTPVRSVNGKLGHVILTTDDIPEGSINKYGFSANVAWEWFKTVNLKDLSDVSDAPANDGDILYYDAAAAMWLTRPGDFQDDFIVSAAFDSNTGDLVHTRTDSNTVAVNLDGRYLPLSGGTLTGPLAGNDAVFNYVRATDSLSANIASFDTLSANTVLFKLDALLDVDATAPTANDILYFDGTTSTWKTRPGDFIDEAVVTGAVTAPGILNLTTNQGRVISTNLSASLLSLTAGGTVTGNTIFNGKLQTPTIPSASFDVTNKAYVDAVVANSEVFTANAVFDTTTGVIAQTRTNGTIYTVGIDGRYVIQPAGATNGQVLTFDGANWIATAPASYLNDLLDVDTAGAVTGSLLHYDSVAGKWGVISINDVTPDTYVVSGVISANGQLTLSHNTGTFANADLSGVWLSLTTGGTVAGNTVFNGKIQTPTVPTANTDIVNKLYVDTLVASGELYTNTAAFDATTGILTQTRNNGTTYAVDLDGRYVQTVNSILPDANGNILISLTSTQTGTLGSRPMTANAGVVYVVSGDANTDLNGETYIYVVGSGWQQITPLDTATYDARYVNVTGDAMTGFLTLNADPTANLHAVTKQYVDAAVTNSAVFNTADGVVTLTRSNGTSYTVDIDGRYLELANGGTVAGPTVFNSTLQTPSAPTVGNDVTNKQYVDALIANSEVYTNTASFDFTTGVLTQTRNNGTTYTADLDGRYLELTAGGTVAGNTVFNAALQTPTAPIGANDVTNKIYVDTLVANSEVYTNTAAFDTTTGILTQTRTNGTTYTVDLDGRYLETPASANTGQVLTFNGANWAPANTATKLVDLLDVAATGAANGSILYYNATTLKWTTIAGDFIDNFLSSAAFNTGDGIVTLTRNDGNTVTVDIDGRYLELTAGGTVTGNTVFNGKLQTPTVPTSNNDVTNKLYVDSLIASSEVFTNTAAFDTTTGVITQTRTNGTTYTVDIDGRYLELVAGGTVTGNTVFSGNVQTPTVPAAANDVTNKAYVDALVANAEVFTNTAAFDATTGVITQTRNNGTTYTVDIDGRYLELTAGGTVAGNTVFSGNVQTPTAPTANNDLVNKLYVDNLVATSEVFTNTAAFDTTTGVLTQTRTNGTTYTVDLDGRYLETPASANTGQVLTYNGATWAPANTATKLADLLDVDVAGVANGDILYYNATSLKWDVIAGDFIDNFLTTATFNAGDGIVTLTRNDGNTITVDIDGRYLELTAGGTVTGNTLFNGKLQTPTVPAIANDVTNKAYVDALVANSEVYTNTAAFDTTTGVLTQTRTNGSTYTVDLDGRYLELLVGGTVAGPTIFSSTLQTPTAPLVGDDVTNKTYVDALVANSEVYTANAVFDNATGIITQTRTDGTSYAVDLDGRYGQTVNGITPDAAGNIAVSLTETYTGDSAVFAGLTTANSGAVFVISGDANTQLNGKTYIYESGTNAWYEVKGFDEVAADARYVNVGGDVMTGFLTLSGDPVSNLHAASKQYVDAIVANSEVYTANAVFSTATGVVTLTRTDGISYTVDLDGRYLELTAGGTVAGPTIFSSTLQTPTAPTSNNDVANKLYVDSQIANAVVEVADVTLDSITGDLILTETTNAANVTHTVNLFTGLDGRYVNVTGDTMTGPLTVNGTITANGQLVASNTTLTLHNLADVNDTAAAADGEVLTWNNTTMIWESKPIPVTDTYVSTAAFGTVDGIVTLTRNDGNTVTVDLDGRYLELANGGIVTGGTTFNGTLQTPTAPVAGNDVTNKTYVDAQIANAVVEVADLALDNTTGILTLTETTNAANVTHTVNLFTGLDGRYVNVDGDTMTGQLTVSNNVVVSGQLQASNTTLTLHNLADVNDTAAAANGEVLTWDATAGEWKALALPASAADTYVTSAAFNTGDGIATLTRNDGNTVTVDLDGRYLELANGGIVTGDTTFNGLLQTPTVPTSNNDVANKLYVDSQIANSVVEVADVALDSTTGILTITETSNAANTTHTVDLFAGLDARYVNASGDTVNGALIINGDTTVNGQLVASNTTLTLHNLADVNDTAAAANGEVLTWDATAGEWKALALPAGSTDTFVNAGAFDIANGDLTLTRNDGNTVIFNMDGRYLELANGGIVTGPTIFSGGLQSNVAPLVGDDVTNKTYVDNLVANAVVEVVNIALDSTTGILTLTETSNAANTTHTVDIFAGLDGRYVNITGDTMTGPLVVNGDVTVNGQLIASNTTLTLENLANVNDTVAANGQVLTWDATAGEWKALSLPAGSTDTFVTTAVFGTADGIVTLTRNDGNTVTVDLDGRYLELANGGIVTGDTTFNGKLQTPTVPTSNNDVANKLYVDTLVAASEVYTANATFDGATGILTQTRTDSTTYTVDLGTGLDTRYVNVTGDTMTGPLTVNGTITANGQLVASNTTLTLHNLADVSDTAGANGQVLTWNNVTGAWEAKSLPSGTADTFVTSATFNNTDGVVTLTDNTGNTVTVDLDGRYLELTAGGTVAGATIFNSTLQTPTAPTTANDVTNKAYVDALIANSEVYTNTAAFDTTTGVLTQTRTNGTTYTVDLDGRYVEKPASANTGEVLKWDGAAWTPSADLNNYVNTASFGATDGVLTLTRADGTTVTVDLDGRYIEKPTPTANGQVVTWNNVTNTWEAQTPASGVTQLQLLTDVNVAGVTNGQVLTWDSTASKWIPTAAGVEVYTANATFDSTTGIVTQTRNDGTTYTVDLDGRYLELAAGGTVAGATIFSSTLQTPTAPTVANDVTNKAYVDALIANSEVYTNTAAFDITTGVLTQTRTNGSTYIVDLDGRYIEKPTPTANLQVLTWNNATSTWEAQTPASGVTQLQLLTDVNVAGVTNGQVLTWNSTTSKWAPTTAATELYTNTAAFDITTGIVTQTRNDGSTYTVDLDGRYAQSVNGVVPDATGNIVLNITQTQTGTFAAKPVTSTNGLVYVVSGDANTDLNGETYIYVVGSGWQQVTPLDTATYDARYVNVTGDTMTGALTLSADPTAALQAATKQYVDTLVANSEVYTSTASFNTTDGVLTQTRTNGTTYTVDLDGRFVIAPTPTANLQVITWNAANSTWYAATPTGGFDNYIASASFAANNNNQTLTMVYANTAVANLVVDLSHNINSHTDVDTVTKVPVSGSSVLGWDGANWVPIEVLDANMGVANDF